MPLEILLTPHVWLQVEPVVRNALAKEFGITRSTSPRCVTEQGVTIVESDGYTIEDLMGLNVESMQEWLGFSNIDPEADVHALFQMCVDKMAQSLAIPVEEAPQAPQTEVLPEVVPQVPKEVKARFCVHCESKGVRHFKTCPNYKSIK